jgi:hypothetical protein
MQPAARRVELSLPSEQVSICNIVRRETLRTDLRAILGITFAIRTHRRVAIIAKNRHCTNATPVQFSLSEMA